MGLEIELELIERYKVKMKGVDVGEFEKVDKQEGISKLKSDSGVILIDDSDPKIFENIFKGVIPSEPSRHNVIKITPSLIPTTEKAI